MLADIRMSAGYTSLFPGYYPPLDGFQSQHRLGGRPAPTQQSAHPVQVVGGQGEYG